MPKKKNTKDFGIEEYIEDDFEIEEDDDYFSDEIDDEIEEEEETADFETIEDEETKFEEADDTFRKTDPNRFMKFFNVIFVLLILSMLIIGIDVICVARYNKGPFFAIPITTYDDGGTKEYYGLGYKVIKYNEIDGRQDTQIGFWSMKYNTEPIIVEDIDLAIEFQNKPDETANKFYKQYVKVSSTIKKINTDNNEMTLQYTDPDGKYTLQIKCQMASNKNILDKYKKDDKVSVKGTIYKFSIKEEDKLNTSYLSNCIVE